MSPIGLPKCYHCHRVVAASAAKRDRFGRSFHPPCFDMFYPDGEPPPGGGPGLANQAEAA